MASLKNIGEGLPNTVAPRREAYSSPSTTCVETQFAVAIEKIAVFGQGYKCSATNNLTKGLVQQIICEKLACISDNDGFLATGPQSGKIFAQIRMHDEKWRQIPASEKVPSNSGWCIDIIQLRSKSHLHEIVSNARARTTRRVGNKF
jgi:hypothetical protein